MQGTRFPQIVPDNHHIALIEGERPVSYADLSLRIQQFAVGLLGNKTDLQEERVAFFIPASLDYVTTMHGIWCAGGIAVPLNVASSVSELEHYLSSAGVTRLIANADYQSDELLLLCQSLDITVYTVDALLQDELNDLPIIASDRRALMLFTSGTTDKPKGVVHTHHSVQSQIVCLLEAWEWTKNDVVPLFLPLHHIHGIINILSCGLWAGATVHLFPKFDIDVIAKQIALDTYTVFMAVPTIYVKFIQYFATLEDNRVKEISKGFANMRLNISGSAACPVKLFNQWRDLTGQVLLERYGMTEIGMGISNPYQGERRAGCVGYALPGVEVKLFNESDSPINQEDTPGEIRIQSNNLFLEYWDNDKATKNSFKDGWFCTGDMAVIEDGYYRIMGRTSIDIIKSGGYKLSALEIEGVLLNHESIAEVAVIGVEDDTWGEAVAAVVVLVPDAPLTYSTLRTWCAGKMSAYKIPKILKIVEALPRNAMGKVTKPDLKGLFAD